MSVRTLARSGRLGLPGLLALALALPGASGAADPGPGPTGSTPADPVGGGAPEAGCAVEVAKRVQAHYDGVRDLRARFEQQTEAVAGGASGVARGRVVFAKPGRMRWEYQEPSKSTVVSDGETLWIWDPVMGEAQKLPVTQGFLSGAAIQFLLGEGKLLESFEVSAQGCQAESGAGVWLELTPREAATYERLRLRADPQTGRILETGIVDLLGNRTRIAFLDVEVNRDPDRSTFEFVPPKGARVVEIPPSR